MKNKIPKTISVTIADNKNNTKSLKRYVLYKNPWIETFARYVKQRTIIKCFHKISIY